MNYFTRAWANGELSDADFQSALQSYKRHIGRIKESLPEALAELASDLSIHDGLIRRAVVDRQAGLLTLELICGDLPNGYFDLDLVYGDIDWDGLDLAALARRANDGETEILQDEIDREPQGVFEHRLLFWPDDELTIRFRRFELRKEARDDRSLEPASDRYVER